ncbi:MAG: hypothetical protein ACJ73D_02740 [Pyrinomonadaceae bacterium]
MRIVVVAILSLLMLSSLSYSQELPSSIRGYKVHRTKVHIGTAATALSGDHEPNAKVGEPRLVDVSLTGVTLEATAEISGLDQDGQIDFLTFKDVLVNGIPLAIQDYEHPFAIKKGKAVTLPVPIRGTVATVNVAKAAYKETTAAKDKWQVTGTVFVFGRFRKMGMTLKRVIPVPITLTVSNPLKSLASASQQP